MPTSGATFVSPGNSGSAGAPVPIKTPEVDDVAYPGGVYKVGLSNKGIWTFAGVSSRSSIEERAIILDEGSDTTIEGGAAIDSFRYGLKFSGIYFSGEITLTVTCRVGGNISNKVFSFEEGCTIASNDWTDLGGYLETVAIKAKGFRMGWKLDPDHSVKGNCGGTEEYDIETSVEGQIVISEGVRDDAIVNNADILPTGIYIIKESEIATGAPNSNPPGFATGRGSISF